MAVSPGSVEVGARRWAVSSFAAKISFSLTVGDIACTLTKNDFLSRPVPDRVPLEHLYVPPPASTATIVPAYYDRNNCTNGQVKISWRVRRCERRFEIRERTEKKAVKFIAEEGAGSAGRLRLDSR